MTDLTRRRLLKTGAGLLAGALGLGVLDPRLLNAAYGFEQLPALQRYDALLVINLDGGFSPYEVCDLKDYAVAGQAHYSPEEYPAGTTPVEVAGATDVYGRPLVVSELLGRTARKVSADAMLGLGVIRSVYHQQPAHRFASRQVNCMWQSPVEQVQPSLASVLGHYLKRRLDGADGRPPAALVRGGNGTGANDSKGSACPTGLWLDRDPAIDKLLVQPPVERARYGRRRAIAGVFNRVFGERNPARALAISSWDEALGQAHDLSLGAFGEVFDAITPLPYVQGAIPASRVTPLPHVRNGEELLMRADVYGAQRLSMATALIEAGVPFVQAGFGGFDTHEQNLTRSYERVSMTLDPLLAGLDGAPGMLDRLRASGKKVLIALVSEFGRQPELNRGAFGTGREHYPWGYSFMLLSVNQPQFRSSAIGDTGDTGRGVLGRDQPLDAVTPAAVGHLLLRSLGFDTLAEGAKLPTSAGPRPPVDPTYYADAPWGALPTRGGETLLRTFELLRISGPKGRPGDVTSALDAPRATRLEASPASPDPTAATLPSAQRPAQFDAPGF